MFVQLLTHRRALGALHWTGLFRMERSVPQVCAPPSESLPYGELDCETGIPVCSLQKVVFRSSFSRRDPPRWAHKQGK